jgi:3-dehydroquinate synthase
MAYSATLANMRGILSDEEHKRLLNLFSRAGLSMDHHQFDEDILDKATKAILRTRDGKLRAAVPSPLGSCVFLNDVEMSEMYEALRKHKEIMKDYPRQGEGLEAFVDSSDTGYTMNGKPVETEVSSETKNGLNTLKPVTNGHSEVNGQKAGINGELNGTSNGIEAHTNGHTNGYANGHANGHINGNGVVNGFH